MSNSTEYLVEKKIRGRVLFTGGGNRIIDDLMRRVSDAYQMEKCPPVDVNFENALKNLNPHAVVACLSDETRETLRMFSVLQETPNCCDLPVIVIGNGDDCDIFKKNVLLENVEIFIRPVDSERFMTLLDGYLSEGITQERKLQSDKMKAEETQRNERLAQEELMFAEKALVERIEKMTRIYGRKTILVVDDDVTMLNVIKLYLQDLYDVVVVPSGKLALKYLSKKSADLVLLDYMMPEEDGPSVLQQIRQKSPQSNIPVVFLTGVSDKDMVMRGLEFGPNGYLLKPVTRELLLEKTTEIVLGL